MATAVRLALSKHLGDALDRHQSLLEGFAAAGAIDAIKHELVLAGGRGGMLWHGRLCRALGKDVRDLRVAKRRRHDGGLLIQQTTPDSLCARLTCTQPVSVGLSLWGSHQ